LSLRLQSFRVASATIENASVAALTTSKRFAGRARFAIPGLPSKKKRAEVALVSPRLTSMLKIYGKRQSRAARCLWLLEEMGLPYEQMPVDTQNGDTRTPAYLGLNPSGKVPTLDDDGFALRESIAITTYLVEKAETPLWPADVRTRALIQQWSSWAVTDMESPLNAMFREKRRMAAAGAAPDAGFMAAQDELATKAIKVLDTAVAAHPYVVGETFTLGDINAYTAAMLAPMFVDLSGYPAVRDWMSRCAARPAWKRVEALP